MLGVKVRKLLRGLIRLYQLMVSPVLGQCCRFYPSCSEYAMEAVQKHGCLKGMWLTTKRVVKCGPWHKGGTDLVP
ncbi:MAG: membrane protein insertion efficiency factor YidD [Chlamydiota bacterium]